MIPEVDGVLTADEVLTTAKSIAAIQEADGGIPWPDGHVDAWNHIECAMALSVCGLGVEARRAYDWLARTQRADGSWPIKLVRGTATDHGGESNHAAYIAVGVWHELLITRDNAFATRMWPRVRRALDFVVGLQTTRGEIIWKREADGSLADHSLLTGCSSIYQGLRCGVLLADYLGDPQPDWELAADQLGHVLVRHPEAFADKSRYSMDWYYPILGGALRGPAATRRLANSWETFVVPGLGVRCVSDQPWVTGAETCELVLALDAIGDRNRALALYGWMQHLRDADGAYWTGYQFVNDKPFPHERSAYTAAAVVLAADTLAACTAAAGIFRTTFGTPEPSDPVACGCETASSPEAAVSSRATSAWSRQSEAPR